MQQRMNLGRAWRRGWWIIALVAAVTIAAAAVSTSQARRVYRASATLTVTPSPQIEDVTDRLRSLDTLERRTIVATLARIAPRRETRERAAKRLAIDPKELRAYWIGGSVLPNTNIVRIDVEGPDPARVAEVANAAAAVTRREAGKMYPIFRMRELADAEPPRRPVRPDTRRNLTVAALLGLFFGAVAAVAIEALRSRSPAGS